jgi:hypothetical protein
MSKEHEQYVDARYPLSAETARILAALDTGVGAD